MPEKLDLTKLNVTFPALPDVLVPQRNWVNWIHDRFSPNRKAIVVQAPDGSGKTTLLSQFARTYSDRCFSFFITPDQYSSTPRRFYFELCEQLRALAPERRAAPTTEKLDLYELQREFSDLYYAVARKAKRSSQSYFFVIDGLEWDYEKLEEESIRRLIPTNLYPNIYLLASSRPGQEFDFPYESEQCPLFSEPEMADYFRQAGFNLEPDDLKVIYRACDGMPGYIDQLRRETEETGADVSELVGELPSGFRALLQRTWDRASIEQEELKRALALMAHSKVPLDLETVVSLVEVDRGILSPALSKIPILANGGQFRFVTDAHRQFVAEKLAEYRPWVEEALITYYSEQPYSATAVEHLPRLLRETGSYEKLTQLVTIEYLTRTLVTQRDIYQLSRNVQLVARSANEREDWATLSKYTLVSGILRTLSTEPTIEREVEALLSIKDYEQSYALVNSNAILPIDRLQLLARIGSAIRQEGDPVPEAIRSEVEQLVAQIFPTESARERILRIGADLFHVHSKAATDLVGKVLQTEGDGRTADILLALLSAQLESDDSDYAETLRSQIKDKHLRDFTRAHPPELSQLSADSVLEEAEQIEDVSFRLLLLRSWCNAHREDPDAIRVIDAALELITAGKPNPSMRHLRQFAEPLRAPTEQNLSEIVERFDLLKDTALKPPLEELVRLELILASVEAQAEKQERARNRLEIVHNLLNTVEEIDVRCYILVRLLLSLPDILPQPQEWRKELQTQLESEYQQLLATSAEQWLLADRLFGALTNYDEALALQFAGRLNVQRRRDNAFSRIAVVYAQNDPVKLDYDFIGSTLAKIDHPPIRDWTIVSVIESLDRAEARAKIPPQKISQLKQLMDWIKQIDDAIPRSFAWSLAYSLYLSHDQRAANVFLERMYDSWREIDDSWTRVQVGFDLATNLAHSNRESAEDIIAETRKLRSESVLTTEIIAEVVINALRLGLRVLPDVVKQDAQTSKASIIRLLDLIKSVPSQKIQGKLLTEMVTRLILAGKQNEAEEIINTHILPRLDQDPEHGLSYQVLRELGPSILEYERSELLEEVSRLPVTYKDQILAKVIEYLLSGRPSGDPVSWTTLSVEVDYPRALRICELLEALSTDYIIYEYAERLVDLLIKRTIGRDGIVEECRLSEKQALRVAKELQKLRKSKLPDTENIQHEGYRVALDALIARLRASAQMRGPYRATVAWEQVAPTWQEIVNDARHLIPNIADRAYVLSLVGAAASASDLKLATTVLEEARKSVYQIPNLIDRGNRLVTLAEAWEQVDDKESAKFTLQEAWPILQAWRWDTTRDAVTGKVLEMAHSLDPDLAASLTSTVDNPYMEQQYREQLDVKEMAKHPTQTNELNITGSDRAQFSSELAWELLRSLCSGRGRTESFGLVRDLTSTVVDADFQQTYRVIAWALENEITRYRSMSAPALQPVFSGILDSIELALSLGDVLTGRRATGNRFEGTIEVPAGLKLFSAGNRKEAMDAVYDWLTENADEYVKIYDPYFSDEDLVILRSIPSDVRVTIITSWKAQAGISIGDTESLKIRLKNAWASAVDPEPPSTRLYVFGVKSTGDSPLHERFIITNQNRGLRLGTSHSGLGKKDSDIRELSSEEVAIIERDRINVMIIHPPAVYNNERLLNSVFDL